MHSKTKKRWSWKPWQARLDASNLSEEHRAICQQLHSLSGWKPRWVEGWQINFSACSLVLAALREAEKIGLAYRRPGTASFLAVLEEPPPAAGSLVLSQPARDLLTRLFSGWQLYHVNKAGYINQPDDPHKWYLHREEHWTGYVPAEEEVVDELGLAGLLERDGCGHGWPFQWTWRFRPCKHRLYAVRGWPAAGPTIQEETAR